MRADRWRFRLVRVFLAGLVGIAVSMLVLPVEPAIPFGRSQGDVTAFAYAVKTCTVRLDLLSIEGNTAPPFADLGNQWSFLFKTSISGAHITVRFPAPAGVPPALGVQALPFAGVFQLNQKANLLKKKHDVEVSVQAMEDDTAPIQGLPDPNNPLLGGAINADDDVTRLEKLNGKEEADCTGATGETLEFERFINVTGRGAGEVVNEAAMTERLKMRFRITIVADP